MFLFHTNTQVEGCQLTAGLCRPHTSGELCGGCDQTSEKWAWPARGGGADPLFYKQLSEHCRPDQARNAEQVWLYFPVITITKTHHARPASSVLGKGTLTARHRLWIGPMTFEVEVEHRMRRQVAIYFSIVRRKACWASLVSLSTSVSKTTEKKDNSVLQPPRARGWGHSRGNIY